MAGRRGFGVVTAAVVREASLLARAADGVPAGRGTATGFLVSAESRRGRTKITVPSQWLDVAARPPVRGFSW